jgi:hypothetical protein
MSVKISIALFYLQGFSTYFFGLTTSSNFTTQIIPKKASSLNLDKDYSKKLIVLSLSSETLFPICCRPL